MSPALQSLIDQAEGLDQGSHTLENHLGGTAGVQLTQLASVARTVDLDVLATLAPALQRLANIALNSQATNPYQLELELGGTAGVQLAILACLMAQAGGDGGGGDFLPLAGGTMDAGAEIVFASDSLIRQNPDGFGLDTVCANNYIHRWENGTLYITDALPDQKIRVAQYKLTSPPDAFQDESLGYRVGSRYILDDGTAYLCTDATAGDAVWEEEGGGGGGNVSDPNVAYVMSDGSDTHGVIGNPHKPYLTLQAAYDDGARTFDIGVGTFAGMNITENVTVSLRGKGVSKTVITNIAIGADVVIEDAGSHSLRITNITRTDPSTSVQLMVNNINGENISLNATEFAHAPFIFARGFCKFDSIYISGYDAAEGVASKSGGYIDVIGSLIVNAIYAIGGNGIGGSDPAGGGSVNLMNSNAGLVSVNRGTNPDSGISSTSGSVNLHNSYVGSIEGEGASVNAYSSSVQTMPTSPVVGNYGSWLAGL